MKADRLCDWATNAIERGDKAAAIEAVEKMYLRLKALEEAAKKMGGSATTR